MEKFASRWLCGYNAFQTLKNIVNFRRYRSCSTIPHKGQIGTLLSGTNLYIFYHTIQIHSDSQLDNYRDSRRLNVMLVQLLADHAIWYNTNT